MISQCLKTLQIQTWRVRWSEYNKQVGSCKKVMQSRYTLWTVLGGRGVMAPSSCSSTSSLEGGELSASRPSRALPPWKGPPVPTVQETGCAPKPVWTQRLQEKFSVPVQDRTAVVRSVVGHYTELAGSQKL
jgi:hypothetical protein